MSSWPYTKLPPEGRFEVYKDSAGKFRFRLRAANNEIIAVSEAYESKASCQNGIQSVKANAAKAKIEDMT
ncbi:MAG: YegP family protein [Candidatus Bathyarchaeota archaeon]|nr:MAG: YegP family protein [Candidatus Bathyarchaeota archaeon]